MTSEVQVIVFDTFGTLVDWRTGIATAIRNALGGSRETAEQLADQWRSRYQPSMAPIRSGRRPYVSLDVLHRENLHQVLARSDVYRGKATDRDIELLVRAWRCLPPWPDVPSGLRRLRRGYRIAPLSNATTRMLVDLSRHSGMSWDTIIGSDLSQAYKPDPQAYDISATLFEVRPDEVLMVAAHNDDLAGARAAGLQTAFLARPGEHGPAQTTDLHASDDWDFIATSVSDLTQQLESGGFALEMIRKMSISD